MAYVSEIKLRVELLQNLGEYTSIKPVYELTAELDEEDDETVVMEELEQQLYDRVQGVIDRELQKRGLPPVYSKPNYFICPISLPSDAKSHLLENALVFGYAEDWPNLLAWTKEFRAVTGKSAWIDGFPTWWIDPFGQKKFSKMLLESLKSIFPISLIGEPDARFNPLKELLEKYRPTPAEATLEQPADVDNGYEEMEVVQQHSDPDGPDDEWEHPDDPDHAPLRHLYDELDDNTIF